MVCVMHIKSYVIRQAHMSDSQRIHFEKTFPKYRIEYDNKRFDVSEYRAKFSRVVLEVGFGMGDATAEIAENHPETFYIGVEVHKPGVGKLVRTLEEREIQNVGIINHDAVDVLNTMVSSSSLDGIHIFFPDPWPKKRHHKRRLIQPAFVKTVAEKLKPGGYVYTVTDWDDYAIQMLNVLENETLLHNQVEGFHPPIPWRPTTAFETKGIAKNHTIRELFFIRA